MPTRYKIAALIVFGVVVLTLVVIFLFARNAAILTPAGQIASQERGLLFFGVVLSLTILVPVFGLAFFIAWKYREGGRAEYKPEAEPKGVRQIIWWVIPSLVILILATVTWNAAHQLDPHKKIVSEKEPMTIEVVALRWKWLFIYPKQNIATVNLVQFPASTPITFKLTADAPMNSFWIPQLGGQMYAMTGMKSELNLMAEKPGEYQGSAAEISGQGFAGMRFIAKATSSEDFESWVNTVKLLPDNLTSHLYNKLSDPSENNPVALYARVEDNLYDNIIMKYTMPDMKSPLTETQ